MKMLLDRKDKVARTEEAGPVRAMDPLPEVGRRLASGTGRLVTNLWPILQTSVAASLAYFLAAVVLATRNPSSHP